MVYNENKKLPEKLVYRSDSGRTLGFIIPELGNIKVPSNKLSSELSKLGMTVKDWFNSHVYNGSSPKCIHCGKDREFLSASSGYRATCGDKECISKEYTRAQKESRLKNPERWEKQSNTVKALFKNAEYVSKWNKGRDKMRNDPIYKLHKSEAAKKAYVKTIGSEKAKLKRKNSKEFRMKLSKGIKNAYVIKPWLRKKQSDSHKKLWENDEIAERLISNLNPGYGKKSRIYSKYENKEIKFDSSWERSYFIYMSEHNPEVVSIRRDIKCIKYFNSSKDRISRYRPDFIVEYKDGHKEMIEIKPKFRMTEVNVHEKREAAEKYCSENEGVTYVILTEDELKSMGVLDEYSAPIYK